MPIHSIALPAAVPEPLLAPFTVPISQCKVVHQTVADWQATVLRDAGVEPGPAGPDDQVLTYDRNMFFSKGFVAAFLAQARETKGRAQAAVRRSQVHDAFGPNVFGKVGAVGNDSLYPMYLERPGQAAQAEATPVVVPSVGSPVFAKFYGYHEKMPLPYEPNYAWKIGHWSDLQAVNWMMVQHATRDIPQEGSRGTNVDVHPSAFVVNSHLGNGVRIGPFAYVKNAIIGDNVMIEEQSSVDRSYVGAGSALRPQSHTFLSSLGPNTLIWSGTEILGSTVFGNTSILARSVARSIIGSGCFLSRNTQISDGNLDSCGAVTVILDGRQTSTQMLFLGCALGDGARVGSLTLAPGCEVPSGYWLAPLNEVKKLPPNLPKGTPLLEANGTFRSFGLKR